MLSNTKIQKLSAQYNFECVIFPEKVFIRTPKAEWYFNRESTSNIKLFHNNYLYRHGNSRGSKFNESFHVQKQRFKTQEEIFAYIYRHDYVKKKVTIKKSRIECIFDKIEANSVYGG